MDVLGQGQGGSKILINNPVYNITNMDHGIQAHRNSFSSAFERLLAHYCPAAFYNSDQFDETKCHPETRKALLQMLEDWARALEEDDNPICWLYGPAGIGKTAIAKSLGDLCAKAGTLAASFFFWKTDPGRNDEKKLIPTLAYELARSIPSLRTFLEDEICRDPAIFCRSLADQLNVLILNPLEKLKATNTDPILHHFPSLFIIDGLDECGLESTSRADCQDRVLKALFMLAERQNLLPFRVLIISRIDKDIRQFFSRDDVNDKTHRIHLDDSFSTESDIRVYITSEFKNMKKFHPDSGSLPPDWPGRRALRYIVRYCESSFICAKIIMKFIRDHQRRPALQLEKILKHIDEGDLSGRAPIQPFLSPLYTLYRHVISCAADPETALRVIAFFLAHNWMYGPWGTFLQINYVEASLALGPGTIRYCLRDFEAVLSIGDAADAIITFHHATFTDFLQDKDASGEWYIGDTIDSFGIRDLNNFHDSSNSPIEIQKYWFDCFCYIVTPGFPGGFPMWQSGILERFFHLWGNCWSSLPGYSYGVNFLRRCGISAGAQVQMILNVFDGFNIKCMISSFKSLVEPLLLSYIADPWLHSLLMTYLYSSRPDLAKPNHCESMRRRIQKAIVSHSDIVEKDRMKLQLLGPLEEAESAWILSILPVLYAPSELSEPLVLTSNPTAHWNATLMLLETYSGEYDVDTSEAADSDVEDLEAFLIDLLHITCLSPAPGFFDFLESDTLTTRFKTRLAEHISGITIERHRQAGGDVRHWDYLQKFASSESFHEFMGLLRNMDMTCTVTNSDLSALEDLLFS